MPVTSQTKGHYRWHGTARHKGEEGGLKAKKGSVERETLVEGKKEELEKAAIEKQVRDVKASTFDEKETERNEKKNAKEEKSWEKPVAICTALACQCRWFRFGLVPE